MRLLIITVHVTDSGLVETENLETIAELYHEIVSRNQVAKSCHEIILWNYCETIEVAFIKAHLLWNC